MSELRTAGEQRLLECLDDAADELRELMERWDNRLTLERDSLAKRYVEQRLAVLVQFKLSGRAYWAHYRAIGAHCQEGVGPHVATNTEIDTTQGAYGKGRDEQAMLILNVEVVEGTKRSIPSVAFVWADGLDNETHDIKPRNLYLSAIDGRFKFCFVVGDWKAHPLKGLFPSEQYQLVSSKVKSRSQVVEGVPEDDGEVVGRPLRHFELDDAISRIGVRLGVQAAEVGLHECSDDIIEIIDVLFGPFDL